MTVYISVSFKGRAKAEKELNAVMQVVSDFNLTPFIFIGNYHFTIEQEQPMMLQDTKDIDECNLLIAETSEKQSA